MDPISYPWQSGYVVFNNNPIAFIDPSGLEGEDPNKPKEADMRTTSEGCKEVYLDGRWVDYKFKETALKEVAVRPNKTTSTDNTSEKEDREFEQWRQSVYNRTEYFPSTSGDFHSIGVGLTPLGVLADAYTMFYGKDGFTGEEITGVWRYAGIVPFVSEFRKGAKVAKGVTVIGEGMTRVETTAAKIPGARVLNDMPIFTGKPWEITSQMMQYNRKWILNEMRSGRTILDIGRDLNRIDPSIFYQMEQNMLKNYQKLYPGSLNIITL